MGLYTVDLKTITFKRRDSPGCVSVKNFKLLPQQQTLSPWNIAFTFQPFVTVKVSLKCNFNVCRNNASVFPVKKRKADTKKYKKKKIKHTKKKKLYLMKDANE